MARIKLIKATTSITKRNVRSVVSKYLPYANLVGLVVLTLKVFKLI